MLLIRSIGVVLLFACMATAIRAQGNAQQTFDEKIYTLGKGIVPPKIIESPGPDYSHVRDKDALRHAEISLMVTLDSKGQVRHIEVLHGLGKEINQAAVDAVATWKFEPARQEKDQQPVAIRFQINLNNRRE